MTSTAREAGRARRDAGQSSTGHPPRRARRSTRWGCVLLWSTFALFAAVTPARAATLSVGEVSGLPGQSQLALPLSLALASGEQVSAFSVDVRFDPAVTQCSAVVLEPSVLALNKQAQTNQIAPGHLRLIVYGTDRQVLSSGRLAQCVVGIAADASAGSSVVSLQSGMGTDPNGAEQSLALTDGRVWVDPIPDTTAPQIGSIAASGITTSAATIAWTTDEAATSQVEYGTSTIYGQATTVDAGLATAHQMGLAGLSAGTLYHYRVRSRDAAGNESFSADWTFTTTSAPAPSTTAPSVTIVSPQEGSTVIGSSVYLEFTVTGATIRSGSGYQHLHIKLDGGKVWHVYNTKPFLIGSLTPGTHTVFVSLAENETHARVAGTSTQQVSFTVR